MTTKAVTSVSGLGDDAYYFAVANYATLLVKKCNVAFKVAVYGRSPLEQKESVAKTLAGQVVSKL